MRSATIPRPTIAGLLAIAAMLAATLFTAAPAAADHNVTPARLEGDTRFATAAEIAEFTFPQGSGVALLANGVRFADALAAAPLSRSTDAPLLLTQRDRLPAPTDAAFTDLGVSEVVILGGPNAVSTELEAQLQERFDRVVRFAGDTRFGTATRIAQSIDQSPNAAIGEIDGQRTAMIVYAFAPADAVLAASFAAGQANPFPVLFTAHDTLTLETEQALGARGIEHVIIVGGPLAVSNEVEQRLADLGMSPTRLAGQDRLQTAAEVADHARLVLGWDTDLINLARGDVFADALAAGPYAGRTGSPILLTENSTELGQSTAGWLRARCPGIATIRAIGGQEAITTTVLNTAVNEAKDCHDGQVETQQTYMVGPMEAVEADIGSRFEARVIGRYDDAAFTGPLNIAIFPCAYTDVVGPGPDTFQDADGDQAADFRGESDGDSAAIVDVNGSTIAPAGQVTGVTPTEGTIVFGLRAEAADCVVVVAYDDTGSDGQLDVDSNGEPTEPYGVTEIAWG